MKRWPLPLVLVAFAFAIPLRAAPHAPKAAASAAPSAPIAAASVAAPVASAPVPEEKTWASCTEHVPTGATRPALKEQFPRHATSGYAAPLEVTIEHGKGESVLPQGFQTQASSAASRELAEAGFVFPEIDGGAGPSLTTTPNATGATTKISIPVLLLPKKPGRNRMTLPPVPIAVARASGELLTLCTVPHEVVVDDPTASTPDAKPRANPEAAPTTRRVGASQAARYRCRSGRGARRTLGVAGGVVAEAASTRSAAAAPAPAMGGRVRRALRGSSRRSRQGSAFRRALRSRLRCGAQVPRRSLWVRWSRNHDPRDDIRS